MPKEVADALKKQGHWRRIKSASRSSAGQASDRRAWSLRAGAGAGLGDWSSACRCWGAQERSGAHGVASPPRLRNSHSWRSPSPRWWLATCGRIFPSSTCSRIRIRQATHLQDHRRVGKPRRFDAAVGADSCAVRCIGGVVRPQLAGPARRQGAERAGIGSRSRSSVHPASRRIRSCASRTPPSKAATSTRSCRIPAWRSHPPLLYRRLCSASPFRSRSRSRPDRRPHRAAWARWVRPWTLLAWIFLTLGIAMGSYWAYYTLGWGGWWFWDPVENASFMPWLAATALLHSALVMEKRNALKVWTILLAILAFSLSLIGTFLVRSGVLTSVHAFAPIRRAAFSSWRCSCCSSAAARAVRLAGAAVEARCGLFAPISREGALVLNNLFLVTACGTVFVGTLYPLALEAITGEKISVGAPFFNATFGPLFHSVAARGAVRSVARLEARRSARRGANAADRRRRRRGGRHGGDIRDGGRRPGAGAFMSGSRSSSWRRRHRSSSSARAAQSALGDRARPCRRSAALGLGQRRLRISGSASRCSASSARPNAAASASPRSSPARRSRSRGYELHFDGPRRAKGPNYREPGRAFHGAARRRDDRRDGAFRAHLSLARSDHAHRSRR